MTIIHDPDTGKNREDDGMEETRFIRRVDGEVDDVAIGCDMFRLEQMDDAFWWAAIYRGKKRVVFDIIGEAPVKVYVREDDLGCVDDTGKEQPNDQEA